jgi:PAS domain S-box-containing protein
MTNPIPLSSGNVEPSQAVPAILERISDAFYALDDRWRFTYINREAERVLNREHGELLGMSIWDAFPHALGNKIGQQYHLAVETQQAVEFETYYPPLSAWFELRAYPGAGGLSVYFRDITMRKRTEAALRESEERFRTIYEEAPSGIIVVNLDGQIVQANHAFCAMVDYREDELQAMNIDDITHPDDRQASINFRQRLLSGNLPRYHLHKRYIARDGSPRWSNLISNAIRDEHGAVMYGIGMVDDVTTEKRTTLQIEAERRRVAYDLHDGLAQVAVSLHQHLQTFADDYPPPSPPAAGALAGILDLAQRTVREARQLIAGLRPTVLDEAGLANAIHLQLDRLRDEGWTISFDEALGAERLPAAVETALFWVAQEALTNIRKHAGVREAHITLLREDAVVRLEVVDLGCGFDSSVPMRPARSGERIGLLGMRERIALLGGVFLIESQPGKGTRLTVTVQLAALATGYLS